MMRSLILWILAAIFASPEAAAQDAYLKLISHHDTVLVVVGGHYEAFRMLRAGDSLAIPAGRYRIVVAAAGAIDYIFDADFVEGETLERAAWRASTRHKHSIYLENSSYPPLTEGLNVKVFTESDADVYIDGELAGQGDVFRQLPAGEHLVEAVHRHAGRRRARVTISDSPPRLTELDLFTKPGRPLAAALGVVPGASQWYKNQRWKGVMAAGLISGAIGVAYRHHAAFGFHQDEFLALSRAYEAATDESEALRLGDQQPDLRELRNAATAGEEQFVDALSRRDFERLTPTEKKETIQLAIEAGAHSLARSLSTEAARLHPMDVGLTRLAHILRPPATDAVEEQALWIRGFRYVGSLHRLELAVVAEEGRTHPFQATAVDPSTDTFYFGEVERYGEGGSLAEVGRFFPRIGRRALEIERPSQGNEPIGQAYARLGHACWG